MPIYRGYEVEKAKANGIFIYNIYLYGEHVCSQPSEEFAYAWIDALKKADKDKKNEKH